MGKKPRAKKTATDSAKNPDPTSETPNNNGLNHREPETVVSNKPSKNQILCVRRSGRLQSVIKPVQNQEVEEIDLVESEREEDGPQFEENDEFPLRNGGSLNGPTTNEKAEDVIKAVEVLKSKVGGEANGSCESPSVSFIYKSLYLDSQKKIEALTSENHELARKLEIVLGKLEVYEDINKSQTVIISNMEKAIEALVRSSSSLGGDAGGGGGGGSGDAGGGGSGVATGGGGGGMVRKEASAKKRRQDQKSN